jgi:hypothetical protein
MYSEKLLPDPYNRTFRYIHEVADRDRGFTVGQYAQAYLTNVGRRTDLEHPVGYYEVWKRLYTEEAQREASALLYLSEEKMVGAMPDNPEGPDWTELLKTNGKTE